MLKDVDRADKPVEKPRLFRREKIEVKSTKLYAFGKPGKLEYVDDDEDYRIEYRR